MMNYILMTKKTIFFHWIFLLFSIFSVSGIVAQKQVDEIDFKTLFPKNLQTINDIERFPDSSVIIFCSDKIRGGFFKYDRERSADSGISFPAKAINGGSWVRIFQSAVNVQWYGASGDGKTNDAEALQRAILSAAALKMPVFFPKGSYFIPHDFCLIIPGGSDIAGMNKENSTITTDSISNDEYPSLIKITGHNVVIRNLGFNGGRQHNVSQISTQKNGRHNIVNISYDSSVLNNISFQNCLFSDAYGRGVAYKAENLSIKDCSFTRIGRYNIEFETVDGAISNYGRPACKNIRIENNRFSYIGTHAIASYKITGLTINNNILENISGIGIGNQECVNVLASGNRISFTGDNGMDFQRCDNVNVTDNFFYCSGDKHAGDAGSAAAIFLGDDYGSGKSNKAVINNNFIKGNFNFRREKPASFQNCGIYLIDANYVKVTNNTITQIGNVKAFDKQLAREDGNGIMLTTTLQGQSVDVQINGNSFSQLKSNAIFVNGQAREIKISNNIIERFGENGIVLRSIGTNLFNTIENNTVTNGLNFYKKDIASDIFVEVQNGWITHCRISGNQLRNNNRLNFRSDTNKVYTTHGIYFSATGFGKFNNLIVNDNQIQGHGIDEIGFSSNLSEYRINKDISFPSTGFTNNFSGSTDDNRPYIIIPGFNQKEKPEIITESFANRIPEYGNYSAGSTIKNADPANGIYAWVVVRSGFAAGDTWKANKNYTKNDVVFIGNHVWRCVKKGISGIHFDSESRNEIVKDGSVEWESMGQRALFKTMVLQ